MTLIHDETACGKTRSYLTTCPACGYEFAHRKEPRAKHIATHSAEDFGL